MILFGRRSESAAAPTPTHDFAIYSRPTMREMEQSGVGLGWGGKGERMFFPFWW